MPDQHDLPEGVVAQWRTTKEGHEAMCVNVADLPKIEAAAVEEERERLLSDEVVEAVARIPWDNDFPGAWDRGVDPESEEDRDPRPQARSDVRSCIEAALAALDQEDDRG